MVADWIVIYAVLFVLAAAVVGRVPAETWVHLRWPKAKITLRRAVRVVHKRWAWPSLLVSLVYRTPGRLLSSWPRPRRPV